MHRRTYQGKNNPNWRGGMPYCMCGQLLSTRRAQLCKKCYLKLLIERTKQHHPMKGKTLSNEHKMKIRLKSLGRKLTPEAINKIRQKLLGRKFSMEHRKKLSIAAKKRVHYSMLGKHHSQKTKDKLRQIHLGKHTSPLTEFKKGSIPAIKGKHHSLFSRQKMSKTRKKLWQNKEWAEQQMKKMWSFLATRPTDIEKKVIRIIKKNNLPYKYVGDGSFWIGHKNPDFINTNNRKILIEVGNVFHHQRDYVLKREKHFAKYGWKSNFLINDNPTEQQILKVFTP